MIRNLYVDEEYTEAGFKRLLVCGKEYAKNIAEITFVKEVEDKFKIHGTDFYLSDAEMDMLKDIASR